MSYNAVYHKLLTLLILHSSVDAKAITGETEFVNSSFNSSKLIVGVQNLFSIDVSTSDIEKLATLGESTQYVMSRLQEKNQILNTVRQKLDSIIIEQLNVPEDLVVDSARFIEDLGADSLDLVELVMEVEYQFDLIIIDEDAEQIHTVLEAYNYIIQHI